MGKQNAVYHNEIYISLWNKKDWTVTYAVTQMELKIITLSEGDEVQRTIETTA